MMAVIKVVIMAVVAVVAVSGKPTGTECLWNHLNGSESEDWTPSLPLPETLPVVVKLLPDAWQEFSFGFELSDSTPVGSLKFRKVGENIMLTLKRLSEKGSAFVHMSDHQQQIKVPFQVFQKLSPTNEIFLNLSLNRGHLNVELDGVNTAVFDQVNATDFYQVYAHVSQGFQVNLSFSCNRDGKVSSALPLLGVYDDPQRSTKSTTVATVVIPVILALFLAIAAAAGFCYYKRTRNRANAKHTMTSTTYVVNKESYVNEEKQLLMNNDGKQVTVDGVQDTCVVGDKDGRHYGMAGDQGGRQDGVTDVEGGEDGRQVGVAGVIDGENNRKNGVRVERGSEHGIEEGVTLGPGGNDNKQGNVLDGQDGSQVGVDDLAGGQETVHNSNDVLKDRTGNQTNERQINVQNDQQQPEEALLPIYFNYKNEECYSQPVNAPVTLDNQIDRTQIIVKQTEQSKALEKGKNGSERINFFASVIDGKPISDSDKVDEGQDVVASMTEQKQNDDININSTLMNQSKTFIRSDGADCHQDTYEATSRVQSDKLMNLEQKQMQINKSGKGEHKIRLPNSKDDDVAKDKLSNKLTHISNRETISPATDGAGERKDNLKFSSLSKINTITDIGRPNATKHSSEVTASTDDPIPPGRIQDASQEAGNGNMDHPRRNQVVREEDKSYKPVTSENVSQTNNTEDEMSTRNIGDSSTLQYIENIKKINSGVTEFQAHDLGYNYPNNTDENKIKSKVKQPYSKKIRK